MRIFHYSSLEWEKGTPIFHFKTEDGLRFKMYGKGKLVRLEFMKDIAVLEALSHKSNEIVKSESIQEETDLTRSMVYYRLSQKLNWLLEKVGRKWKLKKGALQVIVHFLKMIGEVEDKATIHRKGLFILHTFRSRFSSVLSQLRYARISLRRDRGWRRQSSLAYLFLASAALNVSGIGGIRSTGSY